MEDLMKMKLEKLSEPLDISQIDFRIQSVSASGYATILAYKDSRVDMQRLDDSVGVLNWKREHTRDNKNCIVSIWDDEKKQWISKEDTGTESNTEKEKGLASDSFKRACFNFGIGRELYDYPHIFLQLFPNEFKEKMVGQKKIGTPTFDFKLNKWTWSVEFDGNKKFKRLIGKDQNGLLRFDSNKDFNSVPKSNTPVAPTQQAQTPVQTPPVKVAITDAQYNAAMKATKAQIPNLEQALTKYLLTPDQENSIIAKIDNLKKGVE